MKTGTGARLRGAMTAPVPRGLALGRELDSHGLRAPAPRFARRLARRSSPSLRRAFSFLRWRSVDWHRHLNRSIVLTRWSGLFFGNAVRGFACRGRDTKTLIGPGIRISLGRDLGGETAQDFTQRLKRLLRCGLHHARISGGVHEQARANCRQGVACDYS